MHAALAGKVIGTVSIGLLAGATLTGSVFQDVFTASSSREEEFYSKILVPLSATAATSLIAAFALSPATARHPYLLYAALTAAGPLVRAALKYSNVNLSQELGKAADKVEHKAKEVAEDLDKSYDHLDSPTSSSSDDVLSASADSIANAASSAASELKSQSSSSSSFSSSKAACAYGMVAAAVPALGLLITTVGIHGDWL